MGDWFTNLTRSQAKCPAPFQHAGGGSCVMPCPADKKFIRRNGVDGLKCVYQPDNTKTVPLVSIGTTIFDGRRLEDLQRVNPTEAAPFTTERDRFRQELTTLYANIGKDQKIADAFKDLQAAENARDQSPGAYQTARTAYYTLVKGPEWINEERTRIGAAEVAPEVEKYRTAVDAVSVRTQEQQKTIDIVNGIKDKVLSLKDDFKYSVNTFSDQLEKVKIQLNMENRSRTEEMDTTWTWVDVGLNALLVSVLLYAVYMFARRYFLSTPPSTVIGIPTYTGQPIYS